MTKTLTKLQPKDLAKTDFNKLSKQELVKIAEDFMLPLSNPDKYKAMVEEALPELVKKTEDREIRSTTIMQMSEEYTLAVVETLKLFYGFSDEKISEFLKDLVGNMHVVKEIEEGGLSMLSDHSMKRVVQMVKELGVTKVLDNIAEIRYKKERMWKSGLEHPQVLEGSSISRRLQKPGK